MKKALFFLLILGSLGGAAAWRWHDTQGPQVRYRTSAVRKGDIRAAVSATGTIEPEEVVDVGAQVAGEVISFGVDPTDSAKTISYGSPVQSDYEVARTAIAVAESGVAVARANLAEAEANLGYTTIQSPVKGVILDRRVNIGQTVVASLNAPSLFLIAKDLGRMEIWASVNETDIGSIRIGQAAHFTVGAFPGETFRGTVTQIRLNASMVQNVVTYTVAVAFDNPGGKLLPYLTARVEFEVEAHQGVLLVPKAALRWQPKPEHVVESEREAYVRSLLAKRRDPADGSDRPDDGPTRIWVATGDFVRPIEVKVGISDGITTEVSGHGVDAGTQAVIGIARTEESDISSFLPHTRSAEKAEGSKP